MNPAFLILVTLSAIAIWFLSTGIFSKLGSAFDRQISKMDDSNCNSNDAEENDDNFKEETNDEC